MKELVDMLTKNLGVNASQAEGGAGVLFKAAQEKLGAAEFGKLGLSADDAKKFVPVILQFLQTKVGPDVVKKLQDTLKA